MAQLINLKDADRQILLDRARLAVAVATYLLYIKIVLIFCSKPWQESE